MREILFKAKRIDNGEWVEGWLFKTQEHTYIAYDRQFNDDLFLSPQNIFIAVDENTICQYTGLTDKNGNKIWENDIVDIQHYASKAHKIKWGYGGFYVGINGLLCHYNTVCEVIGNIFDNPELLKGSEDNG